LEVLSVVKSSGFETAAEVETDVEVQPLSTQSVIESSQQLSVVPTLAQSVVRVRELELELEGAEMYRGLQKLRASQEMRKRQ
jgi:hypothetical protein